MRSTTDEILAAVAKARRGQDENRPSLQRNTAYREDVRIVQQWARGFSVTERSEIDRPWNELRSRMQWEARRLELLIMHEFDTLTVGPGVPIFVETASSKDR